VLIRFRSSPLASAEALRELRQLIGLPGRVRIGDVVKAQHQSLSRTGGSDAPRIKSSQASQLPLFHPPVATPRWESLPPKVRQEALLLLVQWLRGHARDGAQDANEEVHDE
jgi:hypothetical protein